MWRRVLGGVGVWTALVLLFTRRSSSGDVRTAGWTTVDGARVKLERDVRYRACVRVPWYVPTHLVQEKLPAKAAERGFRDVVVSSSRPSGWPDVPCDLWVEATWGRDAEEFERPADAVPFAWRRVES